jgi:GH25 family lysozyme M1 (1,4-beta-N-acetylmuramidase)
MADDPSIPNVFGWDASNFDWDRGPMDLAAAARDGIQFFTHKATEGGGTRHSHYGEAMRRARDAGIPVLGAYHVVRSSPSVTAQADHFLSYLDSQTPWWRNWPDWFAQVDLEKWPYDAVPARIGEEFADLVEQRTGRKAVIYASRGQYGNELTGTNHLLWNAHYGTNPVIRYNAAYAIRGGDTGPGWVAYSGRMPTFWQYGSQTIIGNQPICDANAFRGTLAELKALIAPAGTAIEEDDSMQRTAYDPATGYWIGDGIFRRKISQAQCDNWTSVGVPHDSPTGDIGTYGRDVAELELADPAPVDVAALAAALAPLLPQPPVPPTADAIADAVVEEIAS